MAFSAVKSKFSEHGLGAGQVVDTTGMSPVGRRIHSVLPIPSVVANSTTKTGFPVPSGMTRGIHIDSIDICWYGTVPAQSGGTTTIQFDYIAADGTTATVIVTAVTLLTGQTTMVPLALTLAATNPTANAGGGSIVCSAISSNNTVQTSGAGYGFATVYFGRIEETIITVSET